MGTFEEKMKTMPRIKAEAGEMVIIETTKDGVSISEVVCYVEEISYNMKEMSSKVKLSVYNPHGKGQKEITEYRFN